MGKSPEREAAVLTKVELHQSHLEVLQLAGLSLQLSIHCAWRDVRVLHF